VTTLAIAAAIGFAWCCGRVVYRFGQPPVIGELAAGIVLGPSVFGAIAPAAAARVFTPATTGAIDHLAYAAILVFMFLVGLELDTAVLRRHARGVARIAVFSLVVPFLLGTALATWLYPGFHGAVTQPVAFSLFIGTAMAITAMPVLTRILQDWNMLATPIGTIVVGCAAIDDVAAWTMLGVVVGLAHGQTDAPLTIALAAGYVAMMLLVIRPGLRQVSAFRERRGRRALWLLLLVAIVTASAMATEGIGIHAVFGAFLAGVCVPRVPDVLGGLEPPLRAASAVLMPAFFVVVGLKTELGLVATGGHWAVALAILACASAGKLGGSAVAARSAGFAWRDALVIGALLNTRGLVALVALDIGRELGILSPELFTMFVIMAFVTTLATGPLVKCFRRA
jgi:Kef-type K+ transport system membrane component KefB